MNLHKIKTKTFPAEISGCKLKHIITAEMQVNKKHELHSSDVSRTHIEIEFYHKKYLILRRKGKGVGA